MSQSGQPVTNSSEFHSFNLLRCSLLSIAFLFGAIAMAGWIFQQPHWRSFLAHGSEMKPNSALCFMLLSLAVGLRGRKITAPSARIIAHLAAILVGLLATLTLAEYYTNTNL